MNNPIGLQTSYWKGGNPEPDIYRIVDLTKDTGVDQIELTSGDFVELAAAERRALKQYIDDAGLRVLVNGGLVRPERDISSPDATARKAGLEHSKRMLDLCAEMGAPVWSGLLHSPWNLRPDPADAQGCRAERRKYAAQGMAAVAEHAQKVGVVCCIEIVNRFEQFILNTVEEGVSFCAEVGHDHCKVLLDTYHMNIEENYAPDSIRYAVERGVVGCIHIGESNRRIPTGEKSNINWREIADAIKESGYGGPLAMEPFELVTSPAAFNVSIWRGFLNPSDINGMVEHCSAGVQFLRSL